MAVSRTSGTINWRRIVTGGLIAGVCINTVQIAFHWVVLGGNWWFFRALTDPIGGAPEIVRYAGLHFIIGIAAVWVYAAACPRYGPGPKTAVRVGLGYWVIGYAVPTLSFYPLLAAEIRGPMWLTAGLVDLVGITLALLCGAWFYSEKHPAPNTPLQPTSGAGASS